MEKKTSGRLHEPNAAGGSVVTPSSGPLLAQEQAESERSGGLNQRCPLVLAMGIEHFVLCTPFDRTIPPVGIFWEIIEDVGEWFIYKNVHPNVSYVTAKI